MGLIENTLIGIAITLAAVESLIHTIYKPKTNQPTTMLSHEDHENNRIVAVESAERRMSMRNADGFDGNVSIVWKDKSFLLVMVIFTCIGYLIRMLPISAVFHLLYAIIIIIAILKILSKNYVVTVNWLHGNIYIIAEFQMRLFPKFKFTKSYKYLSETSSNE